jgi:hypothetical protein
MEYWNAYSIQFFKNNFVCKFFNTVFAKLKLIYNFVDRDIILLQMDLKLIVSSFFANGFNLLSLISSLFETTFDIALCSFPLSSQSYTSHLVSPSLNEN